MEEKNKRNSSMIPIEIVAQLLIKSGEEEKGYNMISKMDDVEV